MSCFLRALATLALALVVNVYAVRLKKKSSRLSNRTSRKTVLLFDAINSLGTSGVSSYSLALHDCLSHNGPWKGERNYDISTCALWGGEKVGEFSEVGNKSVLYERDGKTRTGIKCIDEIQSQKPHVVVATTIKSWPSVVKARELKIPTIWVFHMKWDVDSMGAERFAEAKATFNQLTPKDAVIFVSAATQAYYKESGFQSPASQYIVEGGVDLARIDSARAELAAGVKEASPEAIKVAAREAVNGLGLRKTPPNAQDSFFKGEDAAEVLRLSGSDFVFLQIGIVSDVKNQLLTARAFVNFLARRPAADRTRFKLLLVGARNVQREERAIREEILRILAEGAPAGSYAVIPLVTSSQVLSLGQAADVTLMPSKHEALPLAPLELMALKSSVLIASNVGGLAQIGTVDTKQYFDSNPMLLFELGRDKDDDNGEDNFASAMMTAVDLDAKQHEGMLNAGRKRAEDFSSYSTCTRFEKVLQKVVK